MGGIIPPATLEQIRAASDIVEVIGAAIPLKRAGANFVALCPFHREKTPSFHVNPQRQIFHCFGCHKGGDVFTFIREHENLSFVEAVRRLAERAHIPLEFGADAGGAGGRHVKESLLQLHEQIAQRWQNALAHEAGGALAREYLAQRRVPPEAIQLFRLGAAPEAWDDTVNWARSRKLDLALVEQAGLIIPRDGGGHYDRFRGRLMFPICDEQGRVIGFSGRILNPDPERPGGKYVNSPETPLFTKGKVIYGLDKSKRALLDTGSALVCEGQLDLIACFMAGVTNVVAPQGTALTGEHARILKRYVDEVVLCFDSDEAGQNAALRSLDDLLASGLAIRVVSVPAPHDPDSFIREHGGEAFRALIERAEGFFDFLLKRLCRLNDPESDRGRLAIVQDMGEAVRKTGHAVLADTYTRKTAQRLGVDAEAVRSEWRRLGRGQRRAQAGGADAAPAEAAGPASRPPSVHEAQLLKLLLIDDALVAWAALHLDLEWVQHAGVRQVLAHRFRAQAAGTWRGVAALLSELADDTLQRLVTEAASETRSVPNREVQVQDCVKQLRDAGIDRALQRLTQRIVDASLPEAERTAALLEQQELRQRKRAPLAVLTH